MFYVVVVSDFSKKKPQVKLIQNQSGDMENLLPRYREASESSKISSGSFSDGINSYSHSLNQK